MRRRKAAIRGDLEAYFLYGCGSTALLREYGPRRLAVFWKQYGLRFLAGRWGRSLGRECFAYREYGPPGEVDPEAWPVENDY